MARWIARKRKKGKTLELFLTPVLNIFLTITPLLLVTAVFLDTAVIKLSLPSHSTATKTQTREEEVKPLILSIADRGFYLIRGDKLLKIIPRENDRGNDRENDYDFDKLEVILKKIKESLPEQRNIIIESEDNIVYDNIIQTMDRCRACGLVNIILSASKN